MFTAVAIFCLIASLLAVVVFLVGGRFWEPLAKYTHFGLVVTAASIAYLLKEFFIRHAYNVRKEIWALAVNLILFASMAILLAGQYFSHITLTVEAALWIYTLAHIIAAVFGCFKSRLPFKKIHSRGLGEDWRESWRDGLWASITNLVSFLRGQAHTIVAVALMGPIGVGKINAARLFVTPAVMLTPALAQIAIPRLSTLRTQGMQKMLSASRLVTAALFAVAMLYSIVLLMTYYFISPLIMGFKYENLFTLTMAWCVYACIFSMRSGAEMNMQALMEFKFITSANIYSAFMALGFSFILALIWSLPGIVIGLAIGEMVLFIFYQRRQLIAGIYSKINSAIL
jgi:O-antigen/teichoic acid export membrane protein